MAYADIVEKAIDKRINEFKNHLNSNECDAIDNLVYRCAIGTLEDLKKEVVP